MSSDFRGLTACFFARLKDRKLLRLRQWYGSDIRLLEDLGFIVVVATKLREIPLNCDLYFAWWATWSVFPLVIAKLCRKPIIVVAGGDEVLNSVRSREFFSYHAKPFYVRLAIRFNLKYADSVLAVSQHILDESIRLRARNAKVVYHGIDVGKYRPVGSAEKRYILTICNLGKGNWIRKRLHTLLRAIPLVVREYPDQEFVLLGEKGDGLSLVEHSVEQLGIEQNLIITGEVSEEKKMEYFQMSLMYVQPTIHEGFGVAIAEAMSCGLPVITSDVGAVREVVGDAGMYVDPDNPEELAHKILFLLQSDDARNKIGSAARKRIVRKFPLEKRKAEIARVVEALLAPK